MQGLYGAQEKAGRAGLRGTNRAGGTDKGIQPACKICDSHGGAHCRRAVDGRSLQRSGELLSQRAYMLRGNGARTVAFCCISTGEFHFPNREAARIAIGTVTGFLSEYGEKFDRVIFNVFKDEDKVIYEEILKA